jgi:hypothetical protein
VPAHNISFLSGKYQVCALAGSYSVPHHPTRQSAAAVPGRAGANPICVLLI